MSTLYDRIRQCRIEKGYTQEQLASMLGYTDRSSIAKIEKGLIDLSQSKITAFANALGVSTLYLMSGQGEKSEIFRKAVRAEIENCNALDDAIEAGLNIDLLDKVAYNSGPLTLDDACDAADELGVYLGDLLGEIKDPVITSTSDEQVKKIIELFASLPAHKQQEAIRYIRYLADSPDTE